MNQNNEEIKKTDHPEPKDRLDKVLFYSIVSGLIAIIASSLLMVTYIQFKPAHQMKFAIVDLALIVDTLKEQAREAALAEESEDKRAVILERFSKKMGSLEQLLKKESDNCQCNILVKSALPANYDVPDLTSNLMKALKVKVPQTEDLEEVEELEP